MQAMDDSLPIRLHMGASGTAYVKFDSELPAAEYEFERDFGADRRWNADRKFWAVIGPRAAEVPAWLEALQAEHAAGMEEIRFYEEDKRATAPQRATEEAAAKARAKAAEDARPVAEKAALEARKAAVARFKDRMHEAYVELRGATRIGCDQVDEASLVLVDFRSRYSRMHITRDGSAVLVRALVGGPCEEWPDAPEEVVWRQLNGVRGSELAAELRELCGLEA